MSRTAKFQSLSDYFAAPQASCHGAHVKNLCSNRWFSVYSNFWTFATIYSFIHPSICCLSTSSPALKVPGCCSVCQLSWSEGGTTPWISGRVNHSVNAEAKNSKLYCEFLQRGESADHCTRMKHSQPVISSINKHAQGNKTQI